MRRLWWRARWEVLSLAATISGSKRLTIFALRYHDYTCALRHTFAQINKERKLWTTCPWCNQPHSVDPQGSDLLCWQCESDKRENASLLANPEECADHFRLHPNEYLP